jgi:hypothetical protein
LVYTLFASVISYDMMYKCYILNYITD